MSEIVGLITARGGSKRVPRKNVTLVAGKPLIAWTIEAALEAPSLTRVMVSTDDSEIAEISRHYGAEVPFLRPVELSSDAATSVEVALHALNWLARSEQVLPDFMVLLQPSSPLRTSDDIEAAIALRREKMAEAVVSVCEVAHRPQWLRCVGPDGALVPWRVGPLVCAHDEGRLYQLNGAIYLVGTDVFLRERTFFPLRTLAYVMPPERSLDIDLPWDCYLADLILRDKHAVRSA